MIIGLAGQKKTGKTEISKYLSNKLNIPIYSFAAPLKKLVYKISGLTDIDKSNTNYYTGKVLNIEPLKRELKKYNYDKLSMENIDNLKAIEYHKICDIYRYLLQYVGTDIFRNRNTNHWVICFRNAYQLDKSYIVDDIRFINEYSYINNQKNSRCVKVENCAARKQDRHVSETELNKMRFVYKFNNKNTGLLQLYSDIDTFFGI
jgi:hypothetical protein